MQMDPEQKAATRASRKPCVVLMGEFSAGKSTLTNLLLSADPLPVQVTATRLPPIRIRKGDPAAFRESLTGEMEQIEADSLQDVPMDETRLIHLSMQSDILDICDLIDMPGISDPNMDPEVWQRVIGEADHVIWLTHASQAWRQSEAAVWDSLPEELRDQSLLLITQIDKILTPKDRRRILSRIKRETDGLFAGVYPIALTEAVAAEGNAIKWEQSGAQAFSDKLIEMVVRTDFALQSGAPQSRAAQESPARPRPDPAPEAPADRNEMAPVIPMRVRPEQPAEARSATPVQPRRVQAGRRQPRGLGTLLRSATDL